MEGDGIKRPVEIRQGENIVNGGHGQEMDGENLNIFLRVLDSQMNREDLTEEEENISTDGSEVIITEPIAPVSKICGLFSTNKEEECESGNEALQLKGKKAVTTQSEHGNINIDTSSDSQQDQSYHEQNTNKSSGREVQYKKRKNSESASSPESVNNNSVNSVNKRSEENKDQLFPLFCKQVGGQKEQTPKDQRKRNRKKRNKMEEGKEEEAVVDRVVDEISEQNLAVLDVRTVMEMLQKIKSSISSSKLDQEKELSKREEEAKKELAKQCSELQKNFKTQMEKDIQNTIQIYQDELKTVKDDLKKQKQKTELVGGILQYNQQVMDDLAKRLDTVELNNAKRCAVLTGIQPEEDKKNRKYQVQQLFKEAMQIRARIDDTYILGQGDRQSIVVIFETIRDKWEVMAAKKKLSKMEGKGGRSIFLNEYLPQQVNESRRRERAIVKDIGNDPQNELETEYTKKGLKIGSHHYRKKVIAPKPGDLLNLDADELEETLAIKLTKGQKIKKGDSVFLAYGLDTKDHQSIRKAHLKVRLQHAQARHVVCAYYLPGAEKHYCQDFEDDEEHGAGRTLLASMVENELDSKAVFVIRVCGREKLGNERFKGYLEAVQSLINSNPTNKCNGKHQTFEAYRQRSQDLKRQTVDKSKMRGRDSQN